MCGSQSSSEESINHLRLTLLPRCNTWTPSTSNGCCSVQTFFPQRKSPISPNLSPWYCMPPSSPFSPPPALWSREKQPLFISERGGKGKKSADLPLMWTIWKFGTWEFEFENATKKRIKARKCSDYLECFLGWHEWKYCCGRIYCGFVWEFQNRVVG